MPNCKPGDFAVIVGPVSEALRDQFLGHFCHIVERVPGDGPVVWRIHPPVLARGTRWSMFLDAAMRPIRGPVIAHRVRKGGQP